MSLQTFSSNVNDLVDIRMEETGRASHRPITVPELLQKIAEEYSENEAMCYKDDDGNWKTVLYSEYQEKVLRFAKVFIKLGLQPRHSVGILAHNCPEWFYTQMVAIYAGGISAGVYLTNSPDAVCHVLGSSNADIVVVGDRSQLEKVKQIRHKLPALRAIIQIQGPFDDSLKTSDGYYMWDELERMQLDDSLTDELETRLGKITANQCCLLVYTSGTVGEPKGVMLSHDNLTWDAAGMGERMIGMRHGEEVFVSYLPLNHIAANLVDIFLCLTYAGKIYFAEKNAIRTGLIKTLCDARPTRFGGVPRVFEKIAEQLTAKSKEANRIQKYILSNARRTTSEYYQKVAEGAPENNWIYWLIKSVFWSRIKGTLGFDRCESFICGGAPISDATRELFMSLDMPIVNLFGLSEAAVCTMSKSFDPRGNCIGEPLNGIIAKIVNPNKEGIGEICFRGRNIFIGYINNPEATAKVIDKEGWLYTGDLGFIDYENFLYITGRLKELIVTAGGENIPSYHVEQLVLSEMSFLSNAVLVGDRRKFLSILLTIKTEVDKTTNVPKDNLHPDSLAWIKSLGLNYSTVSEILSAVDNGPCPKVLEAIQEGINRANKYAISNAQRVQKFAILPRDFSIATGELGPTLKLKRGVVLKMYEDIVESFYKD